MASTFYSKYKNLLLTTGLNMSTSVIKVALVDTSVYTFNSSHDFLDDITGILGTAQTLTNVTVTNNVVDADDVIFTDIPEGSNIGGIIIYKNVTDATDSPLIAFIDNEDVEAAGGNVTLRWSSGTSKIFAL